MPDARNINEVVDQLDRIVANAAANRSRIGFFASLYRQVTLRVRQRIADGFFEDGPRMERLDTIFANRFLDAMAAYDANGKPTESWQFAFDAARRTDLIILQHLLLGINAHINLDLGIAAATLCPGDALPALRGDFERINQILGAMIDDVKSVLEQFSPAIRLIDEIGGVAENVMVNFSMDAARDDAWEHAEILAAQSVDQQRGTISVIDSKTAFLARLVAEPGRVVTAVLDKVNLHESDDVPAIIVALNSIVV